MYAEIERDICKQNDTPRTHLMSRAPKLPRWDRHGQHETLFNSRGVALKGYSGRHRSLPHWVMRERAMWKRTFFSRNNVTTLSHTNPWLSGRLPPTLQCILPHGLGNTSHIGGSGRHRYVFIYIYRERERERERDFKSTFACWGYSGSCRRRYIYI